MGRDSLSVVDANLKVYGIENLRIADGSIMPRVTTGNTMALRNHRRTRGRGHTRRL
jgi:choline dehydrogenase